MWLTDLLFGKIDPHCLYDGLSDKDRRKADRRRAHLLQQRDVFKSQFEQHSSAADKLRGEAHREAVAHQNVAFLLNALYRTKYDDVDISDAALRHIVISEYTLWLPSSYHSESPLVVNHIAPACANNPIISSLFPNLFTREFWDYFDTNRKNAAQEAIRASQELEEFYTNIGSKPCVLRLTGLLPEYNFTKTFPSAASAYHFITNPTVWNPQANIDCWSIDPVGEKKYIFHAEMDSSGQIKYPFKYYVDWRP